MLIGGHVSTRGGIDKAPANAVAIGAEVIQTHPSPPQQWQPLRIDDSTIELYRSKAAEAGLKRHFFHAVYLVNLATRDETMLKKSITSLAGYMDLCGRVGADGVVFHPGSHKGAGFEPMLPQMAAAVREVLARSQAPARFIVENSAGSGGCVGCSFDEVAAIVDAAGDDPRLGVCLDTAHSFASGYELRTSDAIAQTLRAFDDTVGFERLVCVHANDSRAALGSNVDRHANIGTGEIGLEPFRTLLADPRLRAVPWLLETPGAGEGPDLQQVNTLRKLAGEKPATARSLAASPR
jgi:deoxyribonuclease-4